MYPSEQMHELPERLAPNIHELHLLGSKSQELQRESQGSHEFPFLKKLFGQFRIHEFSNNIKSFIHSIQLMLEHY